VDARIEAELVAADGKVVRSTALNDVVLTRGAFQGLLEIALRIGDVRLGGKDFDDRIVNFVADAFRAVDRSSRPRLGV
jgi:hypothetical protein